MPTSPAPPPASGRSPIKPLAELSTLDAGGWFDGFFVGERVPRLDEVIAVTAHMGGGLYVELKEAEPLRTVEAVLRRLPADDVFFWSWNTDWLSQVRRAFAGACLMARAEDFETLEDCLAAFGADIVEFNPANADICRLPGRARGRGACDDCLYGR
jgi:glycerophosphoryl diester phosphodiesterase